MKKNEKGFVLAEAIIVSVFIVGLFAYLAINILPLISRYKIALRFDNPNEIYASSTLYEETLKYLPSRVQHPEYENYIPNFGYNSSDQYIGGVYTFSDNTCEYSGGDCDNSIFGIDYFKTLIYDYLKIKKIALIRNGTSEEKTSLGNNNGLIQYYTYEVSKLDFDNNTIYLLIEFQNGKYGYVSTIYKVD